MVAEHDVVTVGSCTALLLESERVRMIVFTQVRPLDHQSTGKNLRDVLAALFRGVELLGERAGDDGAECEQAHARRVLWQKRPERGLSLLCDLSDMCLPSARVGGC